MDQTAIHSSKSIANGSQSLGELYTRSERGGSLDGGRVVVRAKTSAGWEDTPRWRFYRNIMRAGLYLKERVRLMPGDRVVVLAPLRAERLVAEWAAVAQGAVVATLDPDTPVDVLTLTFARLAPRVAFVSGSRELERVRSAMTAGVDIIAFDDAASSEQPAVLWSDVLDRGGTLDTAERALAFRASARALRPEMPAVAHATRHVDGASSWKVSTHAEIVRGLVDLWSRAPARPRDVAYVVDVARPGGPRLALWALVADGLTTVVIGTPRREAEELVELRPNLVVGPPETLERAARLMQLERGRASRVAGWLRRAPVLGPLASPALAPRSDPHQLRHVLTLEGGRPFQ